MSHSLLLTFSNKVMQGASGVGAGVLNTLFSRAAAAAASSSSSRRGGGRLGSIVRYYYYYCHGGARPLALHVAYTATSVSVFQPYYSSVQTPYFAAANTSRRRYFSSSSQKQIASSSDPAITISKQTPTIKITSATPAPPKQHPPPLVSLQLQQLQDEIATEERESIAWARTTAARKVLESVYVEAPGLIITTSLEDYLTKRQINVTDSVAGLRIASSLLTYPLTLSYCLRKIFPGQRPAMSLLVVGARAESQLPLQWWREALVTCEKTMSIHLKFVGPEACSKLLFGSKQMHRDSIPWTMGRCDSGREVTVQSDKAYQRALHEIEDKSVLSGMLIEADVFVLFNPGFGNSNLKSRWHSTMKLLMATKKPIMCTANSAIDLRRDLDALAALADEEDHMDLGDPVEMLVPPHENPFFSRRRAFDAFEIKDGNDVRTNQFVYVFQMK